jgi:hypothetical protein
VPEPHKQIFVRGLSRSGGTLVVTLLDAHSQIAMSYELYESLLTPAKEQGREPSMLLEWLAARRLWPRWLKLARMPDPGVRTFLARIRRGGLSFRDFEDVLARHIAEGRGFEKVTERLLLIEACALLKMRREGKCHWGLKCSNRFGAYQRTFPNAYFINVIRDGRDVLASQLKTGDFRTTPEQLARSWCHTHMRFRKWSQQPGVRAYELFYERLAHEPEEETRKLCGFLGVPFEPEMLGFHQRDLSIFKAGHLSMKRISSPIDTKMIGRWRHDLEPADVEAFCRNAHDAMVEFGYLQPAHAGAPRATE